MCSTCIFVQVNNTLVIAILVKLAAMSPRCCGLVQEIMDLFEGGKLEKKLESDDTVLTVHLSCTIII